MSVLPKKQLSCSNGELSVEIIVLLPVIMGRLHGGAKQMATVSLCVFALTQTLARNFKYSLS